MNRSLLVVCASLSAAALFLLGPFGAGLGVDLVRAQETAEPAAQKVVIGAPVADPSLGVGSIAVHVVNGSMSRPLSALDVALVGDRSDKELVVRTGPDGIAPFRGLKVGATFTAFIKVGDKEAASQPLVVPTAGGLRVLLSPVPLRAEPGGGPAAGPAAGQGGPKGMPDPRNMSGIFRQEPGDGPGRLTVRVAQGKFRQDEIAGRVIDFPKDAVVHLVAFGVDKSVRIDSQPVDKDGRVFFKGLKTNSTESYWLLSALERNGTWDRLEGERSMQLPPQVSFRLMMAGHAADSTVPPVDDIRAIKGGEPAPKAGSVVVELGGQGQRLKNVEILNIATQEVVASGNPAIEVRRTQIQATVGTPVASAALRDGVLQVKVIGTGGPIAGAQVRVVRKAAEPVKSEPFLTLGKGEATVDGLTAGEVIELEITAVDKSVTSTAITVPAKGGLAVSAQFTWKEQRAFIANVGGVAPGVYVARGEDKDGLYFSPPFQMVPDRGAIAQMYVYPGLAFQFRSESELDDDKLWFRFRFRIWNLSVMPFDTGKDGLLIPLPPGFVGANVAEEMATRVTVDKKHGFIWRGAFPPGQRSVSAGFGLPADDGKVTFDLPLPFGSAESTLVLQDLPGMVLDVPSSAKRSPVSAPNGAKFILIDQISIRQGQTLSLSISGLPQRPAWKGWGPVIAGLGVLGLLIWGFAAVVIFGNNKRGAQPGARDRLVARRETLLAKLLALDETLAKAPSGSGGKKKKKTKTLIAERSDLMDQLETLYEELGD